MTELDRNPSGAPPRRIDARHPLVIWRLTDGKPGHEKQTRGLAQALARAVACASHELPVGRAGHGLIDWALGRFPPGDGQPAPDLILAAGHATHPALLAARRARGGKAVVLMRPSLPLGLFDLCLIPEHDQPPKRPNVIATRGVLTAVSPGAGHDAGRGLILIGGPSAHFRWDGRAIADQVASLARGRPQVRWTLTTSRRTPAGFAALIPPGLADIRLAEDTAPGWVEAELARADQTWVTPDSASMLYEALTAGCRVGAFELPALPGSRVAAGVRRRIDEGWVRTLPRYLAADAPPPPAGGFDEAARCAARILERWFE